MSKFPLTPSESADSSMRRRRFLAVVGTVTTVTLAGCSGRLLETSPRALDTAVHEDSENELSWDFPPKSAEQDSVGYVEIGREPRFDSDDPIPSAGFHFNASIEPSSDYTLDQFTARISTPDDYHQQHGDTTYLAEPPANAGDFRTHYRRYATHREFVIEMRDVGSDGTTQFPFVIRDAERLPSALLCTVSLQASGSGMLGETIQVSDAGTFDFGTGNENS